MNFERPFEQNQGDPSVDLANFNRIVRIVNALAGLEFSQDFNVSQGEGGILVSLADELGGSGELDFSKLAFGYSKSGAVVSLRAGYVLHGKAEPILVEAKSITITADATYLFVRYRINGSATWQSSLTFPKHTETEINWVMYKASLTEGVISIGTIYHLGNIQIPGSYARES